MRCEFIKLRQNGMKKEPHSQTSLLFSCKTNTQKSRELRQFKSIRHIHLEFLTAGFIPHPTCFTSNRILLDPGLGTAFAIAESRSEFRPICKDC